MSDLTVALAGGAIGSVATVVLAQVGKIQLAWSEVALHDDQARELNAQLVAYVTDETRKLARELLTVAEDFNSRNTLHSSIAGGALAERKEGALHRYRDQEWRARLQLAALQASEGRWHNWFRMTRGRRGGLELTARQEVEPFLAEWRKPITRHGTGPVEVFDLTTQTTEDALTNLASLKLE